MEPKFILSKKKVVEQYNQLVNLGVRVSYSLKTNRDVGMVLQEQTDSEFSIHDFSEIELIKNKEKIWFFSQAWSNEQIKELLTKGVRSFVIDNEVDFNKLIEILKGKNLKASISLRMKFQENRIGTGKYFVFGMSSRKVRELISKNNENLNIKLGIHIHRKSQNTSEWEIVEELKDSLSEEVLDKISFVNFGGGLPSKYRSSTSEVLPYIFEKIREAKNWLEQKNIQIYLEPGRFISAPAVKLETGIIQVYDNNVVINTTIYNCALDTVLTGTKLLVENELEEGETYLIKGNSPTRDDIFRYSVKLKNPKVGDKIVFLNAGAYNYSTDFFGYKKLGIEIIDDFS